jgi:integrase
MAIYKRKGSPFFWYEFECAGERIRGSSGCTSQREARSVERDAREKAKQAASVSRIVGAAAPSLRMEDATLRYWEETKDRFASPAGFHHDLLLLVEHFGTGKLLSDISDEDVKGLVAWRAKQRRKPHNAPDDRRDKDYPFLSPATVNHTVIRLQAVFTQARKKWKDQAGKKVTFPAEPNWKEHLLPVGKKPARVLKAHERDRLDDTTREDYLSFQEFALASARRFAFCYSLRWSEVDAQPDVIVKDGKRRPDGTPKDETLPITARIRAILEPLRGNHPEFVFTYVARRNVEARKKGETYRHKETGKLFVAQWDQRQIVKGRRYHLMYNTAKTAFRRAKEAADIDNFGFHGLRRTRATEVHKATKDIGAVQKLLGHGSVTTTMRYLDINLDDVRDAMEKTDQQHGVPTQGPHKKGSEAA